MYTSLVHKICSCYNKGVHAQLTKSTTIRFFEGGNKVPHKKANIQKITYKTTKNLKNLTKRASDLSAQSAQKPLHILNYIFVIFIWKEEFALQTAMIVLTSCLTDFQRGF